MGIKQEGENKKGGKPDLVEVNWDFIKDEVPDFTSDPIDKIQSWIKRLSFLSQESISSLVEKIQEIRGEKKEE